MFILSCPSGGRASGVPSPDVKPEAWRDRAACLNVDPELFFPVGTSAAAIVQTLEAKTVCQGCPVLGQCRELELTPKPTGGLRNEYGVFAGLTVDERRAALARRRRRAQRAARRGVAA